MTMDVEVEGDEDWTEDGSWTEDPVEYPTLWSMSPGFFFRRTPRYTGTDAKMEMVTVRLPDRSSGDYLETMAEMSHWNFQWEAGPYRSVLAPEFPRALRFLDRLQASEGGSPRSDIVLVPDARQTYGAWEPLYHLLPRRLMVKRGIPLVGRGTWPLRGQAPWVEAKFRPHHQHALSAALAELLWRRGLGGTSGSLSAYSKTEPLVVLSHDLAFWRAHLEPLIRERAQGAGRVAHDAGDRDPASGNAADDLAFEMPMRGCELWAGEEEALEVVDDLIERADSRGRVRAMIDAVRSHRVQDDFSARWSFAREDFERKLFRKRDKVKVSFVEFDDSIPFYDENAELHGNVLWRDLMAILDPKDRRVVICLHKGITRVGEIATALGYANHSPISKALERIRRRARRLLDS